MLFGIFAFKFDIVIFLEKFDPEGLSEFLEF